MNKQDVCMVTDKEQQRPKEHPPPDRQVVMDIPTPSSGRKVTNPRYHTIPSNSSSRASLKGTHIMLYIYVRKMYVSWCQCMRVRSSAVMVCLKYVCDISAMRL